MQLKQFVHIFLEVSLFTLPELKHSRSHIHIFSTLTLNATPQTNALTIVSVSRCEIAFQNKAVKGYLESSRCSRLGVASGLSAATCETQKPSEVAVYNVLSKC